MSEVTIYSSTADGRVQKDSGVSWSAARDAATGDNAYSSEFSGQSGIEAGDDMGVFKVSRTFYYFDLSSIPVGSVITNAVLHLYCQHTGSSGNTAISAQEGTQGATLAVADFNNFSGSTFGQTVVVTNTAQYYTVTFNAAGKTFLEGKIGSEGKICGREYEHDYSDVSPSGNIYGKNIFFAEYTGTTQDPKLVITYSEPTEIQETYHEHIADNAYASAVCHDMDSYHEHFVDNLALVVNSIPDETYHIHTAEEPDLYVIINAQDCFHELVNATHIICDLSAVNLTLENLILSSHSNLGWSSELTLEKLEISAITGAWVELELQKLLLNSEVLAGLSSSTELTLKHFLISSSGYAGAVSSAELELKKFLLEANMFLNPRAISNLSLEEFLIHCTCKENKRFDDFVLNYNRDNYECR